MTNYYFYLKWLKVTVQIASNIRFLRLWGCICNDMRDIPILSVDLISPIDMIYAAPFIPVLWLMNIIWFCAICLYLYLCHGRSHLHVLENVIKLHYSTFLSSVAIIKIGTLNISISHNKPPYFCFKTNLWRWYYA